MRRSTPPPSVLVLLLVFAVFVVLFADVLAVSAVADPIDSGAVLAPVSPSSVPRPFSHSSFRVSSRLTDGDGLPIAGVPIEILQRMVGTTRTEVIGTALTRADGSFTALVPPGPSRLIDLAYRGTDGGGYVAQTLVFEHVSAGLRLRITP
jgi:hypothetical protein